MNAQAGPVGVNALQRGQLSGAMCGRLAVVPGHDAAVVHVRLLDRFRQAIIVDNCCMSVFPQQQVTAEARPQAEGVHEEIRQVDQVHGVGQPEVIAVRPGLEFLPQSQPALPAAFRG